MEIRKYDYGYWELDQYGHNVFKDNEGKEIYKTNLLYLTDYGFVIPFDFQRETKNEVNINYTSSEPDNVIIHYKDGVTLLQNIKCDNVTMLPNDIIIVEHNKVGGKRLLAYNSINKSISDIAYAEDIYVLENGYLGMLIDDIHNLVVPFEVEGHIQFKMVPYGIHPLLVENNTLYCIRGNEKFKLAEI